VLIGHSVRPAASLYAVVKSASACAATGSTCRVPVIVPGGNPVTAVPGLTPISPVTAVAPLLVTVEPARTAKFAADSTLTTVRAHAPLSFPLPLLELPAASPPASLPPLLLPPLPLLELPAASPPASLPPLLLLLLPPLPLLLMPLLELPAASPPASLPPLLLLLPPLPLLLLPLPLLLLALALALALALDDEPPASGLPLPAPLSLEQPTAHASAAPETIDTATKPSLFDMPFHLFWRCSPTRAARHSGDQSRIEAI
jgi:hypothetical protein